MKGGLWKYPDKEMLGMYADTSASRGSTRGPKSRRIDAFMLGNTNLL